jgi:hypothetical protein
MVIRCRSRFRSDILAFLGGFGSCAVSFASFSIGFESLMEHSHERAESARKQVGQGFGAGFGCHNGGSFYRPPSLYIGR